MRRPTTTTWRRSHSGGFQYVSTQDPERLMRYLPHTQAERADMLARIGVAHIDDLFADIPADKLWRSPVDLPRHASELEVERQLGRLAGKNMAAGSLPFFVGCGAYKHHVPADVAHLDPH